MSNYLARFRKKFIGDKAFYKLVLAIAVPIIIQNGISSFVALLDNIMVGQIGTEEMSGVSIINQLNFVYMLTVFGGVGGIGIYTSQYFGAKEEEGIRKTFRVKLWLGLIVTILGSLIFVFFGSDLIGFYLHEDGLGTASVPETLSFAEQYLWILMISFPAFFILTAYSSNLRECGETVVPMVAGVVAVLVNLVGNYLLIYGHLGLPKLGVQGAAIATVVSRYVEMFIIVLWTHRHPNKQPWIKGAYRTLIVPWSDAKRYLTKGLPLMGNELLWSAGQAMLTQCYSMRGISVVAGLNIANTLNNLADIVLITMGTSVGIIVGQALGTGNLDDAKDKDNKMLFFAVATSVISIVILVAGSFFFPNFYNTTPEAKQVASEFMLAYAAYCPLLGFLNAAYFTLRAGGKTVRTFLFDSGISWGLCVPVAFVLSRFTTIPAIWIFMAVFGVHVIKGILGYVWVRSNIWLVDLVKKPSGEGTKA